MNKIKFTLLATSLLLAMALNNSCSDDDDDSTPAAGGGNWPGCKYYGGIVCMEFTRERGVPESNLKGDCEEEDGEFFKGSCPSGYVQKCDEDEDGPAYFYGATFQGLTCEQIWNMQ